MYCFLDRKYSVCMKNIWPAIIHIVYFSFMYHFVCFFFLHSRFFAQQNLRGDEKWNCDFLCTIYLFFPILSRRGPHTDVSSLANYTWFINLNTFHHKYDKLAQQEDHFWFAELRVSMSSFFFFWKFLFIAEVEYAGRQTAQLDLFCGRVYCSASLHLRKSWEVPPKIELLMNKSKTQCLMLNDCECQVRSWNWTFGKTELWLVGWYSAAVPDYIGGCDESDASKGSGPRVWAVASYVWFSIWNSYLMQSINQTPKFRNHLSYELHGVCIWSYITHVRNPAS